MIAGLVVGLLGGVVVERYRNHRKDFEARRDAYTELLATADKYWMAMWAASDTSQERTEALEEQFGDARAALEIIAPHEVSEAVKEYETAVLRNADDENQIRYRMVAAMRRDAGPRGLARRRSDPPTGKWGL